VGENGDRKKGIFSVNPVFKKEKIIKEENHDM